MIPLLSINLFLTGVISIGIALKLFLSYRRERSVAVYYFGMFYFLLGLFFVLNGIPLFTHDVFLITWGSVIGYGALLLSFGYNIFISLSMGRRQELARLLFDVFVFAAAFVMFARIINFQLSSMETIGSYVYWQPQFSAILRSIVGLGGISVFAISGAVFFREGRRHKKDPMVYRRSFFLGFGMFAFLFAALFGLLLAAFVDYFVTVLIATIFIVAGLLLALRGITYRMGEAI
jgi:hypothetical protein